MCKIQMEFNTDAEREAYLNGYELAKKMFKRPQGEWIRTGSIGNGNARYECSNCHYGDEQAESQEVPFCWHCGADMRVKNELNRVSKELNSEIEKSKSEIVSDYRDGWRLREGEAE